MQTNTTIERTQIPMTPFEALSDQEDVRLQEESIERTPQNVEDSHQEPTEDHEEGGSEPITEELEYDVKIAGNPISIIAKDWKSKGYLPEEFEVTDGISEEELEEAYRTHKESLVESEIRTRILDELQSQGYEPELVEVARLIKYGVPREQISEAEAYEIAGNVRLDPNSEEYEGYASQIMSQYYADKGFGADKIQRYVERDMEDDDFESIVDEAQAYFRDKAVQYKQYFQQVSQYQEQESRRQAEESVQRMSTFLDKGEIAGRRYSKEQMAQVRKALFERTEVVVDAQGNRRRVTPYEKKRLEYQNNFELNFRSVVDFILGYDPQTIEEEGRLKGKNEALKELNKAVQVQIKGVRTVESGQSDSIQRRELPI